ncbi:MAG TPA: ATP-binding protein [Thermoplasmatales archaeon]|nr:ATP-binding protein [Thermoplasmatales archaeon]
MQERIGTIYGDTTSTVFSFASHRQVKRLDYVYVEHEGQQVMAQIREVKRISNVSLEKAFMGAGAEEEQKISAIAEAIGYRGRRGLRVPRTPFRQGSPVFLADEQLVRDVLGLLDDGAYLGLLKDLNIKVFLDINTLLQKHVSVLAKSGSGKSYAMGVIIEELMEKKVPVVIVDPHGEYVSLVHPNLESNELEVMKRFGVKPRGYGEHIVQYAPGQSHHGGDVPLYLDEVNLGLGDLLDVLPGRITGVQKGILYQAIKEVKTRKRVYLLRDVIEELKTAKSSAKWNLIPQLEELADMGLFSADATPMESLVQKGKCSILNLRGVPLHIQDAVVSHVLTKLFEARKANQIPPFMVVVEESHRYVPERGQGGAISADIIRTVASEGRKFGMGLAVVSQRPARIEKNVVSQCNTQIILKTTNPNDIKAIVSSVEGLTQSAADEIQRLPIGMAIVSGLPINAPLFVEVRVRRSSHGGKATAVVGEPEEEVETEEDTGDEVSEEAPRRGLFSRFGRQ